MAVYSLNREGTLKERYDNYVGAMKSMGLPYKTFDEWLDS